MMVTADKFDPDAQQMVDPMTDPLTDPFAPATDVSHGNNEAVVVQLQAELERLKIERDQSIDRLARLQAEFENARKREARERADFRDFRSFRRDRAVSPRAR